MPFHTLDQIVRANYAQGGHWFDKGTKAWFGSRISRTIYPVADGAYFVTSEYTGFNSDGRAYSVRFAAADGSISTVGEFLAYRNRDAAHRAARKEQRLSKQLAVA
jgi:hypothetical protein